MSIILNLVGFFIKEEDKKYIHIIKISNVKKITYDIIKTYFSSFSIEEEDFKYISLICDAKNIKKEEILLRSLDEEKKIWIFCLKDKIREELINIFINNGHKILLENKEITEVHDDNETVAITDDNNSQHDCLESLDFSLGGLDNDSSDDESDDESDNESDGKSDNESVEIQETNIDIKLINDETKKLFNDNDFIKLINIYTKKPELFKKFYMYISSGIVDIDTKVFSELSEEEKKENFDFIKSLNLGLDDDTINDTLTKYNNHLNFSLSHLLFNSN